MIFLGLNYRYVTYLNTLLELSIFHLQHPLLLTICSRIDSCSIMLWWDFFSVGGNFVIRMRVISSNISLTLVPCLALTRYHLIAFS